MPPRIPHSEEISEPTSINYETDSIRFLFDIYLKEYEMMRKEMEFHDQAREQTFAFLLSLIVGLFALTQIFIVPGMESNNILTEVQSGLNAAPFIYLILAIILLFFPYSFVYHQRQITTLGLYQVEVLAVKLDKIAQELSNHSLATQEFMSWELERFEYSRTQLAGTLRWDSFRLEEQIGSPVSAVTFLILGAFRLLILLFSPGILFLAYSLVLPEANLNPSLFALDRLFYYLFIGLIIVLLAGWRIALLGHIKARNMARRNKDNL